MSAIQSFTSLIPVAEENIHARIWTRKQFKTTIIMLHGVVSHSLWLEPIAKLLAQNGFRVVCPDRRGAGANQVARGDSGTKEQLLSDLGQVIHQFSEFGLPHLCGVCWGANYAINYLAHNADSVCSLSLLAPAVFPAKELREALIRVSDSLEPTEEPIVSIEGFTRGPAYNEFIVPDSLRLKRVSPRFNGIMQEFSRNIGLKFMKLDLPLLVILAEEDRLTDNEMMVRMFERVHSMKKRLEFVPGEHGLQFDAPEQTTEIICDWITTLA